MVLGCPAVTARINLASDSLALLSPVLSRWTGPNLVLRIPPVAQQERIHLQCRRHKRHRFDPWAGKIPEEGTATHSSPAWRIPCTGEPGGPQSMGSQKVRHDWGSWACTWFQPGSYSPLPSKIPTCTVPRPFLLDPQVFSLTRYILRISATQQNCLCFCDSQPHTWKPMWKMCPSYWE